MENDNNVTVSVPYTRKWELPFLLAEGCRRAGTIELDERYWAEQLYRSPHRDFTAICLLGLVKVSSHDIALEICFTFTKKEAPAFLQVLSALCDAQGVDNDVARAMQEVCAIILNG
jgi:hypothetical protein